MQAVVLTLSGKHKGICLAVYCPEKNRLFRLVSNSDGGELPLSLKDDLNLLDVIEFKPVDFPENGPQADNILIDMNIGVRRLGKYNGNIQDIYDSINNGRVNNGEIFGNNSYTLDKADLFRHSLEIAKVSDLKIIKQTNGNRETGKAEFMCENVQHELYSITDFDYDIRKKNLDVWTIGNAFIVVSIPSKPYINKDGDNLGYYKFVSAIYER